MSFEGKALFLDEVKAGLMNSVTAAELSGVLSTVSDILSGYDVVHKDVEATNGKDDLFDAFISAIEVTNRSPKTIRQYKYIVGRLLKDLQIPLRSVTVHHLRSWLAREKNRGIADGTLEGDRQVFSSMFNWLWREGLIDRNPIVNLGTIKVQKKVRKPYADVEIEKLKAVCGSKRDIAIISFLLATGCRVGEVAKINRDDINFVSNEVVVLGKGNKERSVYFDDVTGMRLKQYLAERKDDNTALFMGRQGKRLQENGVRIMLKRLAKAAGIENVHPHKFRRTLATTLIAHGMPIQDVAAILGHEKLDTTMKYISLDKSTIKSNYKKFA